MGGEEHLHAGVRGYHRATRVALPSQVVERIVEDPLELGRHAERLAEAGAPLADDDAGEDGRSSERAEDDQREPREIERRGLLPRPFLELLRRGRVERLGRVLDQAVTGVEVAELDEGEDEGDHDDEEEEAAHVAPPPVLRKRRTPRQEEEEDEADCGRGDHEVRADEVADLARGGMARLARARRVPARRRRDECEEPHDAESERNRSTPGHHAGASLTDRSWGWGPLCAS